MSTERPNIGKSYFSSRLRSDAEDVHFPVRLPSNSEKHYWKSQSALAEIRKFMATLMVIDVLFIEIYSISRRR